MGSWPMLAAAVFNPFGKGRASGLPASEPSPFSAGPNREMPAQVAQPGTGPAFGWSEHGNAAGAPIRRFPAPKPVRFRQVRTARWLAGRICRCGALRMHQTRRWGDRVRRSRKGVCLESRGSRRPGTGRSRSAQPNRRCPRPHRTADGRIAFGPAEWAEAAWAEGGAPGETDGSVMDRGAGGAGHQADRESGKPGA